MNREKYDQELPDLEDPTKPAWMPTSVMEAVDSYSCLLCGAPLAVDDYPDMRESVYSCVDCTWSCTVYED